MYLYVYIYIYIYVYIKTKKPAVRAASKALVMPYMLLQMGGAMGLPMSLSALMSFSYLLPWVYENAGNVHNSTRCCMYENTHNSLVTLRVHIYTYTGIRACTYTYMFENIFSH